MGHFKTTYEMAGPVAKLLPSFKPDQLATVVQALGAAGVNDLDLYKVGAVGRLQEGQKGCGGHHLRVSV